MQDGAGWMMSTLETKQTRLTVHTEVKPEVIVQAIMQFRAFTDARNPIFQHFNVLIGLLIHEHPDAAGIMKPVRQLSRNGRYQACLDAANSVADHTTVTRRPVEHAQAEQT